MQVTFAILQFFLLRCQIANPYLGCKHCVMLQCPYGHGAGMGMFGHPLYAANDVLIQSAWKILRVLVDCKVIHQMLMLVLFRPKWPPKLPVVQCCISKPLVGVWRKTINLKYLCQLLGYVALEVERMTTTNAWLRPQWVNTMVFKLEFNHGTIVWWTETVICSLQTHSWVITAPQHARPPFPWQECIGVHCFSHTVSRETQKKLEKLSWTASFPFSAHVV